MRELTRFERFVLSKWYWPGLVTLAALIMVFSAVFARLATGVWPI